MSPKSQIEANRENAKLSTGPKSEAGKAAAALNNTRHGLAGAFRVLPTESQSDFDALLATLSNEHQPATFTETRLVEAMAQHHWLRRRSLHLESSCYDPTTSQITDQKQLALYLRYQTSPSPVELGISDSLTVAQASLPLSELFGEVDKVLSAE